MTSLEARDNNRLDFIVLELHSIGYMDICIIAELYLVVNMNEGIPNHVTAMLELAHTSSERSHDPHRKGLPLSLGRSTSDPAESDDGGNEAN
jgi:hypothetical protein